MSRSIIEPKGVYTAMRTCSTVELIVIITADLENRPHSLDD